MANWREALGKYQVRLVWHGSEGFDPKDETVDVRLTGENGKAYQAPFVTRAFLDYIFEKNEGTGEFAGGSYYCMPGMVIVNEITEESARTAIEDLIKSGHIENYFREIDD